MPVLAKTICLSTALAVASAGLVLARGDRIEMLFAAVHESGIGPEAAVHCVAIVRPLLGDKRTSRRHCRSVENDPNRTLRTVIHRIAKGSFDHLIGIHKNRVWYSKPERLGGLEIKDQLESGRLLDGEIGRPCAF